MRNWKLLLGAIVVVVWGTLCVHVVASESLKMASDLISKDDVAGIRKMLESDPNLVKAYNLVGWTLLHTTVVDAGKNSLAICALLIEKGADINARDSEGNTPLHFAVYRKGRENLSPETYKAIIKLLLDKGASVTTRNIVGATPMHSAVIRGGELAALDLLIAKKADVNAKVTKGGWTPLHGAAAQGRTDLVEILIKNGADSRLKDDQGLTPLGVAEKMGHGEVAKLLRQYGVRN